MKIKSQKNLHIAHFGGGRILRYFKAAPLLGFFATLIIFASCGLGSIADSIQFSYKKNKNYYMIFLSGVSISLLYIVLRKVNIIFFFIFS